MVTHGSVDTQLTEYRVFRGCFHSCSEHFHAAAVCDGHNGLYVEAVILVGVDVMDETVIDTQALKPQISEITEWHTAVR